MEKSIEELRTEKQQLETRLHYLKSDYEKLIRETYARRNHFSPLLFIISSDNAGQAYRRFRYLQEYSSYRKNQAIEIQKVTQQIALKEQTLSSDLDSKERVVTEKEREAKKLESDRQQENSMLTQLQKKERKLKDQQKKQQRQADELNNKIQKLIADEIIIVDTGSTDKTKEIACKFTNKLYNFEWIDDFAAARNYSFSKSTKEFVMWLDADDIILSDDIKKFIELKNNLDSNIDTVMMKYNVQFDEDDNPICSYYRARLLKRKNNPLWSGPVHEVVTPYGNILYSEIAICHKKLHPGSIDRNVKIYDKFIKDGNKLSPRQEFYYARELSYNKRYKESIGMFNKFLNSKDGWVEDNIRACIDLANLYESIGSKDKILSTLFRSFEFDEPRAEVCCSIGNYFLDAGLYNLAI